MESDTLSDELRRRNFLLNLSVKEGQEIATSLGFLSPSEEVVDIEQTDVLKRLIALSASGIAESLTEAASWFCDVLKLRTELGVVEREHAYTTFLCFALASVTKLIDEGFVVTTVPVEVVVISEDHE